MANEFSYQFQLQLNNGDLKDNLASGAVAVDQTTAKLIRNVQNIGTTEEALDLGDVTTPGLAIFENLDDTNYVEVGSYVGGTFYPFMKLKPGEKFICRLGVLAPYAKANTAAIELDYRIYDD